MAVLTKLCVKQWLKKGNEPSVICVFVVHWICVYVAEWSVNESRMWMLPEWEPLTQAQSHLWISRQTKVIDGNKTTQSLIKPVIRSKVKSWDIFLGNNPKLPQLEKLFELPLCINISIWFSSFAAQLVFLSLRTLPREPKLWWMPSFMLQKKDPAL